MTKEQILQYAKLLLLVGVFLAVGFTVERLVLVNAASYPQALAQDLGSVDRAGLKHLRATACKDDPIEVIPKDGVWILRCGFLYYQGATFLSHTDPVGTANQ
jgi:hypothetical protein